MIPHQLHETLDARQTVTRLVLFFVSLSLLFFVVVVPQSLHHFELQGCLPTPEPETQVQPDEAPAPLEDADHSPRENLAELPLVAAPVSPPSTESVIIFINDGFGLGGLSATSTNLHGPSGGFAIEDAEFVGLMRTTCSNALVTDSAASATAMSTGTKTKRGYVGLDMAGQPLRHLFESARAKGMSIGAITTSGVMDATPAAFLAHNTDRHARSKLLAEILRSGCDVLIGGHKGTLENSHVSRALEELRSQGMTLAFTAEELRSSSGPVTALFGRRSGDTERHPPPPLAVSVRRGLETLSQNDNGFVLLVEMEDTDVAGHRNDLEVLTNATRQMDEAVVAIREFQAEQPGTLLLVTSDHETGAPAITGGRPNRGPPNVEWLTTSHTATWVPVFAFGPGAERFSGVYDNTELSGKIGDLLGLDGFGEQHVSEPNPEG